MSRMRLIFLLILLAIILAGLLALLSVLRGRGAGDPQFAVDEQVKATCTDECVARGQCGTIGDNPIVLAMDAGPTVVLHDRFFPEGATVTITETSDRELIAARNGIPLTPGATPFPHTFYRVNDDGKTAWVSGWCLARP